MDQIQCVSSLSQRSKLPESLCNTLGIQFGDFIRITRSCNSVIVRVIPRKCEFYSFEVSDVVRCTDHPESETNIALLSTVTLKAIQVQIVLRDFRDLCKWNSAKLKEKLVSRILSHYGVVSNCTVTCRHPSAKNIGIDSINVLQTFIPSNKVGRVCKQTKIYISNVVSREHFNQGNEFKKISIGGQRTSLSFIKEAAESYLHCVEMKWSNSAFLSEVLFVGPSGCGKSSVIKKAAYDFGVYLEIIKCPRLVNMLPVDCEQYIDSVAKKLALYVHGRCMLLIEDIDCTDDLYIPEVLLNLLMKMRSQNTIVIGTTTSTRKLYPHLTVRGMFHEQVRIGVPGYEDRKSILSALIPQYEGSSLVDLSVVTKLTSGFVAADLSKAVLDVKRRKKEESSAHDYDQQAKMTSSISTEDFKVVLRDIKPLILQNVNCDWNLKVRPVQWEDIGGMGKIKSKILERISASLKPQENLSMPSQPSTGGVLLYGPPGCCKTTLVRALATKWDATFFSANPAQIYSPYVGDSEKSITQLFHQARLCAPAIIFLDELDCIVGKRATTSVNRDIQEKVLSALLNEMDGVCITLDSIQGESKAMLMEGDKAPSLELAVEPGFNGGIVIIGATNRPGDIDDALLRPGRFDLLQYMGPPNKKERESILKTFLRKVPVTGVDLTWLAAETKYFSGADLQQLCRTAALHAARRNTSEVRVTRDDFEDALRKVLPSLSQQHFTMYENFGEIVLGN